MSSTVSIVVDSFAEKRAYLKQLAFNQDVETAWQTIRHYAQESLNPREQGLVALACLRVLSRGAPIAEVREVLKSYDHNLLATVLEAAFNEAYANDFKSGLSQYRQLVRELLSPQAFAAFRKLEITLVGKEANATQNFAVAEAWGINTEGISQELRLGNLPRGRSSSLSPAGVRAEQRAVATSFFVALHEKRDFSTAARVLLDTASTFPGEFYSQQKLVSVLINAVRHDADATPEVKAMIADQFFEIRHSIDSRSRAALARLCQEIGQADNAIVVGQELLREPLVMRNVAITLLNAYYSKFKLAIEEEPRQASKQKVREILSSVKITHNSEEYAQLLCFKVFSGLIRAGDGEAGQTLVYLRHRAQYEDHYEKRVSLDRACALLSDALKRASHVFMFDSASRFC